jgi:uncharacterized protein (TIGR02594 family)
MKWLEIAQKEIGVKEVYGGNDNPRIIEYHTKTSLKAQGDETAWCSSFVNWCIDKAGMKGTNSAAARSWLAWGVRIPSYRKGCIVVLKRGTSSWQGHVGFAVDKKFGFVKILGGNQSNAVNEKWYPSYKVLGYRWPISGV